MNEVSPLTATSSLAERLSAALVALTPDQPAAVHDLRALYAPDMVFRDPIQEVRGLEPFIAMNARLLRRMRRLSWTITLARGDDKIAFLEWRMSGAAKLGPKLEVEGMTRVSARGGLIIEHRDYWDLGELAASSLPGGRRLLRALLSPFA